MAKLVRDRIPEIIQSQGKACKIRVLTDEEYRRCLHEKLDEELAEFHKNQNLEELADLMEVILAAAADLGYTPEDLERLRREKAAQRGGFAGKVYLESIE